MMHMTHNRPLREEELPAAVDLFLSAVGEMNLRHNINAPLPPRAGVAIAYRHIWRTGIFHAAEVDGRIAAICHAIVRDNLWFLSGFWAVPELKGQRIGGPLLRGVWEEGVRRGAETFFVWSSVDETAMASYFKLGMLPGYQMLTFAGTPEGLPDAPAGYEVEPLTLTTACEIDWKIRATRRETDHRFWTGEAAMQGRQIRRDESIVGYFYFKGEAIGPAAWLEPEAATALLTMACRAASAESATISLRVPGVNHDAIHFALQTGLRYTSFAHLLTSAPFGCMEQYLASGPALF
ncbi:MAG: hypothetical protein M3371_04110 [Acidobacteriota bacterium]|nr:hypothetical protein [Acidobacteriota bacterium]